MNCELWLAASTLLLARCAEVMAFAVCCLLRRMSTTNRFQIHKFGFILTCNLDGAGFTICQLKESHRFKQKKNTRKSKVPMIYSASQAYEMHRRCVCVAPIIFHNAAWIYVFIYLVLRSFRSFMQTIRMKNRFTIYAILLLRLTQMI